MDDIEKAAGLITAIINLVSTIIAFQSGEHHHRIDNSHQG